MKQCLKMSFFIEKNDWNLDKRIKPVFQEISNIETPNKVFVIALFVIKDSQGMILLKNF